MPGEENTLAYAHADVRMTRRGRAYTPRVSRNELLDLLGPGQSREATMARLEDYQQLFAYRYTGAIVTKAGHGPGGWTAYKRPLDWYQIALHLLADRVPGRQPIWYGSRSLPRSRYFCLDVDADRTPERILAKTCPDYDFMPEHTRASKLREIVDDLAIRPAKPPQVERLALVNRALRRMGINPDNPRSVLNLASPSGGRHIYVFFDALYSLDQYHDLLHAASLRHVPGEIEFYPSSGHALRLPFGYIPGQPHAPHAWIQFIDDFHNGRIIQHPLSELYESVANHRSTQARRIESLRKGDATLPGPAKPFLMGQPKHARLPQSSPLLEINPLPRQRYLQLLDGIHSLADAQELLDLGILGDGTRTKALKLLAAHLIWFKGLTAEDAAQFLTEWAMSSRHLSKDIAADLANGTSVVAKHIRTMCHWYGAKKTSGHPSAPAIHEFSQRELDALRPSLTNLAGEERINQAEFLLHFLRFAKRHGAPASDGTGWDAAVHAGKVIRRWPGCSHMKYKERLAEATAAGLLTKIRGPWHRADRPGRATTYRLSIPVIPEIQWVLTYEAALDALTVIDPSASDERQGNHESPSIEEQTHASNSSRPDSRDPGRGRDGILPAPLCPPRSGGSLDSGTRQCHPQPDAAPGLHRRDPQGLRTASTIDLEPIRLLDTCPSLTDRTEYLGPEYPLLEAAPCHRYGLSVPRDISISPAPSS